MTLELIKAEIDQDYHKKWNIYQDDFVLLAKDGEPIRNTLYRIGFFTPNLKSEYFMLLKYVEAYYSKDIMKMSKGKDPKHLESQYCILNQNGDEKLIFKSFQNPYLVPDSCIYSVDNNYFNIETNALYCYSSTSIQSKEFLFLNNEFDDDRSKRGVLKINKKDGTFEFFQK